MKNIYFIGIGGISMCALAHILKNMGCEISGSDIDKIQVKKLKKEGFYVNLGHDEKNITNEIDLVVYSSSIKNDNPELLKAKSLHIKTICRGKLLGKLAQSYKNVISVSGSHGKTTTTSMIFDIFLNAGKNPTAHIGGIIRSINSNYFVGDYDYFITEACEFKDNFLFLKSDIAVITNTEPEHMDYFKTKKNMLNSFQKYADNSQVIVTKTNIKHKNKIEIGKKGYNFKNEKLCEDGCYKFDCFFKNHFLFKIKLMIIGKYNIENALSAVAVAKYYGIENNIIKQSLEQFCGVERRFDQIRKKPSIIHDYAHHPSELKAVINATKNWTKGRLIVVFQPHTYSRTLSLMKQFKNCFSSCDLLVIMKTYSARENEIIGGRAIDLFYNLKRKFKNKILYFEEFEDCDTYLKHNITKDDRVLFLGAGNIIDLANSWKIKN